MSGSKFIYSKIIIIMIIYPSLKQRKALDFANKSSVANLKSYKDEQVPEEKKQWMPRWDWQAAGEWTELLLQLHWWTSFCLFFRRVYHCHCIIRFQGFPASEMAPEVPEHVHPEEKNLLFCRQEGTLPDIGNLNNYFNTNIWITFSNTSLNMFR